MDGLVKSVLLQAVVYGFFWLAWRFRMRDASTPWPAALTVFTGFLSVVLLVTALMSASTYRHAARLARLPEVRTLAGMGAAGNQQRALLVGRAAGDYTVEWAPDEAPVWTTGTLALVMEDGTSQIDDADEARRIGWQARYSRVSRSREWVSAGEPLVVAATVRHGTGLDGRRAVSGTAEVVFRGAAKDFRLQAEARSRGLAPRLGAWAALGGAVVVACLPLARLRRLGAPGTASSAVAAATGAVGGTRRPAAWPGWLDATDHRTGLAVAGTTAALVLLLAAAVAVGLVSGP